MSEQAYLLLGSNLGNREETLKLALKALGEGGFAATQQSALYETEPWGITDQPVFLNMVLSGTWPGKVRELLTLCLEVETRLGRVRKKKWGERLIDIDILYFGEIVVDEEQLQVPHPAIAVRRFTLVPLNEIAPHLKHPVTGQTTAQLLRDCPDQSGVNYYTHL